MIWLLGQNGLLGRELGRQLTEAGIAWMGSSRGVDVADAAALREFSGRMHVTPTCIINCAAYTAVDRAEDEPEVCARLNVEGPRNLAKMANELEARLLHISTDYVFEGVGVADFRGKRRPYLEEDPIAPKGVYGRTKAEGEAAVRELCPQHLIFRTAWLYGADGPNFVFTMLKLMKSKESLGVVADQVGSPTWTHDLARGMLAAICHSKPVWGTYHVSGEGQCSWFEFAQAIYQGGVERGFLESQRPFTLNPLTTDQYPTKAKRPAWSVLSKAKLKNNFGLSMPHWKNSLDLFLDDLQSQGNPRL